MKPIEDRLAALSPERRRLVEIALAKQGGSPEVGLSFSQQGIWFSQALDPTAATFNNPVCLEVLGRLDLQALERAMTSVIRRHEPFRAVFRTSGGSLLQQFGPPPDALLVIPLEDLSGLDDPDQAARALADREAARPFDLSQGPPFRVRVLRLGFERHYLLVTLHHLVSDGWSLGILLSELRAFYTDPAPNLPRLVKSYRDYVVSQRRDAARPETQSRFQGWCDRLVGDGLPPVFIGASQKSVDAVFRGDRRTLSLPRNLVAAVTRAAAAEGATFSMAALAAWSEVLTKWSDRSEHYIGVPVAGRLRPELEPLIGAFVNVAVCRVSLNGPPTRRELIRQVRRVATETLDHQDVPFVRVVQAFRSRNSWTAATVPSAVVVQNTPWPKFRLGEADLLIRDVETRTARFWLELHVWPWPDGYRGWLYYRTDLFVAAHADRMITDWIEGLEGLVSRADDSCAVPGNSTALDLLSLTDGDRRSSKIPPQTALEHALAAIWRDLIGLGDVEILIDIPFFDYGGHSLLLVELQERLRVAFGQKIPVLELLTHSTITDLARLLSGEPVTSRLPAALSPAERAQAQRAAFVGWGR